MRRDAPWLGPRARVTSTASPPESAPGACEARLANGNAYAKAPRPVAAPGTVVAVLGVWFLTPAPAPAPTPAAAPVRASVLVPVRAPVRAAIPPPVRAPIRAPIWASASPPPYPCLAPSQASPSPVPASPPPARLPLAPALASVLARSRPGVPGPDMRHSSRRLLQAADSPFS